MNISFTPNSELNLPLSDIQHCRIRTSLQWFAAAGQYTIHQTFQAGIQSPSKLNHSQRMFEKLSTSDILFISSLYYTSTHIVESLITIENNLFSARKTRISFIQDQMLNEYRCELCMYILYRLLNVDNPSVKWSDWLCKVIELSMQSCGKLLSNSFETYKTF